MTTINTEELKAEVQRIVQAWQTYSDENHVDLLADGLNPTHIQKLFELQQEIKQIEDTFVMHRVPFARTLLMFRDTTPPALPEERQHMTKAQYEAIANQIETTFTKVWIKLGTLLQNTQYGNYRYTLAEHVGRQFQLAHDTVVQEANRQLRENMSYRIIFDPRNVTTMFTLPPKVQRHPFDPTGINPNNRVTETRNIQGKSGEHNFIIPFAAPYFVDTLKVSRIDSDGHLIPLMLNDDYLASGLFGEMSEYTLGGRLVASIILFDDTEASGEFLVEYQTLGGDYVMENDAYTKAVANYLNTPFLKTYGEIIGKPLVLDVMRHQLHVDDLTNLSDFMPVFTDIDASLKKLVELNKGSEDGNGLLDELVNQAERLRETTADVSNQFGEFKQDVTGKVNTIQSNFDGLENRIISQANATNEETKRFVRDNVQAVSSKVNNDLAAFRRDITKRVDDTINANNQQLSESIREETTTTMEQYLKRIPTRQEIENIVTTKADELITPIPDRMTRLENSMNKRLDGQDARIDEMFSRVSSMEQGNLIQRVSQLENGLDGKIEEAKLAAIRTSDSNTDNKLTTLRGDMTSGFDGKVDKSDESYVRYRDMNGKKLINTDIVQIGNNLIQNDDDGNLVIPTKVKATEFLVPSPDSTTNNVRYVPVMTAVNDTLGGVINKLTTASDNIRTIERMVQKDGLNQGGLHTNQDSSNTDRRTKFAYTDAGGNTMIEHKLMFNHTGKYLEYHPTTDTFELSRPLSIDDITITGNTNRTPYSVNNRFTELDTTLANHLGRINQLSEKADALTAADVGLRSSINELRGLINGRQDRVQQLNDYQRTADMLNKAPVVQSDGKVYFGGEIILTRPASSGGYNHTASQADQHRVKLAYEHHSTRGKTIVTDAMVVMPNFTLTSDKRKKENIVPLQDTKTILDAIQGYQYTMKETGQTERGVIAQELLTVAPDLVHMNEDGYLSVKYAGLIAVLINHVKQQDARIEKLEEILHAVKGRLDGDTI